MLFVCTLMPTETHVRYRVLQGVVVVISYVERVTFMNNI